MYVQITRGIRVSVDTSYLEDQSSPDQSRFVWAYTVCIENDSKEVVQVRTRTWRITDSTGKMREVKGPGVIGEQPILKPGDQFEYTSGAPLGTSSGFVVGEYQVECESGEFFTVDIPAFSLDSPEDYRCLH